MVPASLAVIAVVALHKWLNEPKRTVEQGILGDARLVTSPAAVRRRNDFWNGKDEPERAGLVFGSSKRGYVFDSSIPHWAIVGKTGAGKTMLMVLQTLHLCMARGWNLIVTGKDELLELTGAKAVDLGYNRVIFDLKGYPGPASSARSTSSWSTPMRAMWPRRNAPRARRRWTSSPWAARATRTSRRRPAAR